MTLISPPRASKSVSSWPQSNTPTSSRSTTSSRSAPKGISWRSGNDTSAISFYNQAISANPHTVDGYLRLEEALIERGEIAPALAEITKAQRVAPGNWKIAWYTGRVLEAQGDLDAAADQYNELIGELPPRQVLFPLIGLAAMWGIYVRLKDL